jgi:hypothetical protein
VKGKLIFAFLLTFLFTVGMSVSAFANNNQSERLDEALRGIGITVNFGGDRDTRALPSGAAIGPHIGVLSNDEPPMITSVYDIQLILDTMEMLLEYDVPAISIDSAIMDIISGNEEYRAFFDAGRAELMLEGRKQDLRDIASSFTEDELVELFNERPNLIREFKELGLLGEFFESQNMHIEPLWHLVTRRTIPHINIAPWDSWYSGFTLLRHDEVDFNIYHHNSSGSGTNDLSVGVRSGNTTIFFNWFNSFRHESRARGTLFITARANWGMTVGRHSSITVRGNYEVWEPSW